MNWSTDRCSWVALLKCQDRYATPCHGQEEKMEAYQRLAERSPYMRCLLKAAPWICWAEVFLKLMYSKLLVPVVKSTMTGGNIGEFFFFPGLQQIQGGSKHWWDHESQGRRGCQGGGSSRHASCAGIAAKGWGISDQALFVSAEDCVGATSWPMWAPVLGDTPECWLESVGEEFHCQHLAGWDHSDHSAFSQDAWKFRHAEGMPLESRMNLENIFN